MPVPQKALDALRIFAVAGLIFAADQWTKAWIIDHLCVGETIAWWPNVFVLFRTHNTGAAFSLFNTYPTLLTATSALLILMLMGFVASRPSLGRLERLCYGFIFGGALGNLIDRARFGAVTDFLYFKLIDYPVFNVADSFICIGVVLLLFRYVRAGRDAAPLPE